VSKKLWDYLINKKSNFIIHRASKVLQNLKVKVGPETHRTKKLKLKALMKTMVRLSKYHDKAWEINSKKMKIFTHL